MYSVASFPPRVAGARPSSRSLARNLRCASIAAVSTWTCWVAALAISASIATVFKQPPLGSAFHHVDRARAIPARLAGQYKRGVGEKSDRFTAVINAGDSAGRLSSRRQAATNAMVKQIDL